MSFKIEKITALMIIEVLGRPESYLKETLESLIKQINEEKGVKLNTKKINEPHHVKEEKDLFTSFAEIEVEVESPAILPVLVFKYMPSHIEVIEPENFIFKNLDFGEMLNEITRRLHKYEELVRIMQIQMQKQDKAGMMGQPQEIAAVVAFLASGSRSLISSKSS